MINDFEKLKTEIKDCYPDFTDAELIEATERLIKFFVIGAKITFEARNTPKGIKNN